VPTDVFHLEIIS